MKRLVWCVLAVFCAALAQLQAVGVSAETTPSCPCCQHGGCDMPGGCPPASATPAPVATVAVAEVARQPQLKQARLPRDWAKALCVLLLARPEAFRPRPAPALSGAFAATVPLFRAQCSLLI